MAHRPTPNLEDQGLFFVWPLPLDQSGMLKVPTGTSFRVIETLKPHHHYNVTTQGEESPW